MNDPLKPFYLLDKILQEGKITIVEALERIKILKKQLIDLYSNEDYGLWLTIFKREYEEKGSFLEPQLKIVKMSN